MKITLQFGSSAPREVFVASGLPNSPPTQSQKSAGATLDFALPAFGQGDRIFVWDHSTNNLAFKAIKDIQNGQWAVKDYPLVGTLVVRVEHAGKAVQAAKVAVSAKGKSDERLLDPTLNGQVKFFAFPAGDLRVKVTANRLDGKPATQELVFAESSRRDTIEPVLTVAISEEVATLDAAIRPPAATSSKPAPDEGSPAGKFVLILIAVAAVGGLAYWIWYMARNKPKQFEETLQKLGVQIPTQQDVDAGVPAASTPLPPAPPAPKIMLDDAEPIPLAGAAVAPASFTASEPVLVRDGGERIGIAEGKNEVGREDGLPISLAGESSVSRKHALLTRSGGTVTVADLGSTNGTYVNGVRVSMETALRPGDRVQFGSVAFRYEGP